MQAQGYVTVDQLEKTLQWTSGRATDALQALLKVSFILIFSFIHCNSLTNIILLQTSISAGTSLVSCWNDQFPCSSFLMKFCQNIRYFLKW
jgi:hypothetical protein